MQLFKGQMEEESLLNKGRNRNQKIQQEETVSWKMKGGENVKKNKVTHQTINSDLFHLLLSFLK